MAAGRGSVVWAESARAALDDVVTSIAQDSREAAVRLLVATLDTASSLDQHAERGRIVPELNQPDLRELFVFDYRLLYRVRPDEVVIVAYLHGARDFATWRQSSAAVLATTPSSAVIPEQAEAQPERLVVTSRSSPLNGVPGRSPFDEGRHCEAGMEARAPLHFMRSGRGPPDGPGAFHLGLLTGDIAIRMTRSSLCGT
jgi:toxin ParE1/3/4